MYVAIGALALPLNPGGGGVGSIGLGFAGYVPLASQNLYPITVYSVARLSFLANLIPTLSLCFVF